MLEESMISIFENASTIQELNVFQRKLACMRYEEILHQDMLFQETYGVNLWDKYNRKKQALLHDPSLLIVEADTDASPDQLPVVIEKMIEMPFEEWNALVLRAKGIEGISNDLIMVDTTEDPAKPFIAYDLETLKMLEQKKEQYNQLPEEDQRSSDRTAVMLFGDDNTHLYLSIKNYVLQRLNNEINQTVSGSTDQIVSDMVKQSDRFLSSMRNHMIEKEIEEADTIVLKRSLMKLQEQNKNHMAFQRMPEFSPYFSFTEMNQFGVFNGDDNLYSPSPDNTMIGEMTTKDWYDKYNNSYFLSENDTYIWIQKMKELYTRYDRLLESGDMEKIAARKQSILELGWNPEINFSEQAAQLAVYRNQKSNVKYVDLSHLYESYDGSFESIINSETKPIFIILFNTGMNQLEKYSNMAVSLDPYFTNLANFCSERFNDAIYRELRTNISLSDYKNQCEEACEGPIQMKVIAVFVKEDQYNKIKDLIEYHSNHKDYDKYNVDKMMSPLLSADTEILPQQFVHTVLKMVNLNTDIKDNITPTEVAKIEDAKVYCVFQGTPDQYNAYKTIQMVSDLITPQIWSNPPAPMQINSYAISNIMGYQAPVHKVSESCINAGLDDVAKLLHSNSVLQERVKSVDADEDGTIVIRTVEDVNTEFFKCHRTLMSLEKAKNYESMKDELCKLKYLDNYAVRHMKNKNGKRYKEYADAHARITNDFNKYLTMVTEYDPKFNFVQYYEKSKWYEDEIRITKNFVNRILEILKSIFF